MRRLAIFGLPVLALLTSHGAVLAQDHADHVTPAPAPAPAPAPPPALPPADPHAGHASPPLTKPGEAPAPADPMQGMDHSSMDHSDAATSTASPGPDMETPPPTQAGSGPPRAAGAIWGADAMAPSRRDLQEMHGDYNLLWIQADRAELQIRDGHNGYLWDVQGYYGGTTSRLWFKSEGEGSFGEAVEDAEVQALYSRAIAPFWDLQAGVRQDVAGPATTHAVVGVQGLAPYMFEIDAALFVSHRVDITARIEAELDQRITQRLILQPRAEINLAAQDVPRLGIGAGVDSVEVGLRLRYEFAREFAPYVGVEQSWRLGGSADYARTAGEDPSVTNFVVGVRFWF